MRAIDCCQLKQRRTDSHLPKDVVDGVAQKSFSVVG